MSGGINQNSPYIRFASLLRDCEPPTNPCLSHRTPLNPLSSPALHRRHRRPPKACILVDAGLEIVGERQPLGTRNESGSAVATASRGWEKEEAVGSVGIREGTEPQVRYGTSLKTYRRVPLRRYDRIPRGWKMKMSILSTSSTIDMTMGIDDGLMMNGLHGRRCGRSFVTWSKFGKRHL